MAKAITVVKRIPSDTALLRQEIFDVLERLKKGSSASARAIHGALKTCNAEFSRVKAMLDQLADHEEIIQVDGPTNSLPTYKAKEGPIRTTIVNLKALGTHGKVIEFERQPKPVKKAKVITHRKAVSKRAQEVFDFYDANTPDPKELNDIITGLSQRLGQLL